MLNSRKISRRLIRLARMVLSAPIGVPENCILHDSTRFTRMKKEGRPRWRDNNGLLYEWDAMHGEIEVYNKRGKHREVLSATGEHTGDAVSGRTIDVR